MTKLHLHKIVQHHCPQTLHDYNSYCTCTGMNRLAGKQTSGRGLENVFYRNSKLTGRGRKSISFNERSLRRQPLHISLRHRYTIICQYGTYNIA